MSRDSEVERLVEELEDKFETYMQNAAADFFRRPDVISIAERLNDHEASKSVDLWPEPLIAQVGEQNGAPVWTWRERQEEDEEEDPDDEFNEDYDTPEFGDDRGDFKFLKGLKIAREGIFTELNDCLLEARQEREDEREEEGSEEAIAWREEPDESEMEDGGAVKKDEREISKIVEDILEKASKLDFFQRVLLFYLLRHKRCRELRKLGVKFTEIDIMQSIDDIEFRKKIKGYAELIAKDPANREQLLVLETHFQQVKDVSAPLTK